jgi:hypothetical protein
MRRIPGVLAVKEAYVLSKPSGVHADIRYSSQREMPKREGEGISPLL